MQVKAEELKAGDRFVADGYHHYTVQGLTVNDDADVVVAVQFADGGLGNRIFDLGQMIEIERPS